MAETRIKYIVSGTRSLKLPIITIKSNNKINIKVLFPNIEEINIDESGTIIIRQLLNNYSFNLVINNKCFANKSEVFDNGEIIITGKCVFETTYQIIYDG